MWSTSASSEGGFVGKKFLASTRPFSQLALAVATVSPTLYLSTGILVFPPSPPAEEVRRCAAQISGSSAFSSQSRQWCLLVWSRVLRYFLTIAACSLCITWSTSRRLLYDCLPSLFAARRSCVSSFVHHLLDFDVMVVIGTYESMVRWIALVRLAQLVSSWVWLSIRAAGGSFSSWTLSSLRNSSQSTSRKLGISSASTMSGQRFMTVRIGRWSVLMPHWSGCVSHVMILFSEWSDRNTWSSLLHFLVTLCLCVGVPLGNASSSPASATASISFSAALVASLVNSLILLGSSQYG